MFHSFMGIKVAIQNYLEENRASWKRKLYCDVKEKKVTKYNYFIFVKKKKYKYVNLKDSKDIFREFLSIWKVNLWATNERQNPIT